MIKLVTVDSEHDSARRLGFEVSTHLPLPHPKVVIVRWGNSRALDSKKSDYAQVLNPRIAIRVNCNKPLALETLSWVVDTPPRYDFEVKAGIEAVLRPHEHSGGSGFNVVTGPYKVPPEHYATKFIRTTVEYRVWFAGTHLLCARRVRMKSNPDPGAYPCRSEWGYRFCPVPPHLRYQVPKAAQAIGLDLGAADIVAVGRKYYFLELNSAPSVDAKKIRMFFQENITLLAKERYNITP